MLLNYFKIALRNLAKNRLFSLINVIGLAVGLTSCLLITVYILHELSYDRHHKLADRLYQVATISISEGKESRYSTTGGPLAAALQQEFPEVESTTRLMKLFQEDKTLFQFNEGREVRAFYEGGGYMADSTFFRLFTYSFVEGQPATALSQPNTVVISQELARKFFGGAPALGRTVRINSTTNGAFDFTVTGVYAPPPSPTHIDARFIMSMQSGEVGPWVRTLDGILDNNLFFTYVLLKEGSRPQSLDRKWTAFMNKYAGEGMRASGRGRSQYLVAVPDVHLRAGTEGNVTPGGSLTYLYILCSIALVTLVIACVNFMNLSTARSAKRATEIGVRKVLGAGRGALVGQFLMEAVLISLLSFAASLIIAQLLLPLFGRISGKEFTFTGARYGQLVLFFFFLSLITGVAAGAYPAFYLSSFRPVRVLKGKLGVARGALSLRKALVVFQFTISVVLIIASVTIAQQMNYLRTKDLGFQKEQQVVVPLRTAAAKELLPALRTALASSSYVSRTGATVYYPGIENVTDWLVYRQGDAPDQTKGLFMNFVDSSYLQTLGIRPVAGRLFSRDFPGDTANSIILNERAVRTFGFPSAEAAIGKNIAATRNEGEVLFPIVGVVKDFHFKGLQADIEPYAFLLSSGGGFNYLIAHVPGGSLQPGVAAISAAWSRVNPNEPFEYSFLDQDFQRNYIAEERLSTIIGYFTVVAIIISCLGLFGLTTFSVSQRTREIGIRKVLGAGTAGLVHLLSRDFLLLVGLSVLVAAPLAWYAMDRWLQHFVFRTDLSPGLFILAALSVLVIAFLTIAVQAVRAALANPVRSLRSE